MFLPFRGKWHGTVTTRNAGYSRRVVVSDATRGNAHTTVKLVVAS